MADDARLNVMIIGVAVFWGQAGTILFDGRHGELVFLSFIALIFVIELALKWYVDGYIWRPKAKR